MKELGVYIHNLGKIGDEKNGWGYVAFFGAEDDLMPTIFLRKSEVRKFDNHWAIYKKSIGEESLVGIESLENINEANQKAYNEIIDLATGIFANLKLDTEARIIDKTGNDILERKVS